MLNLFQHLVCFFLLSADASFIPVHRTGFSDALLIKFMIVQNILLLQGLNRPEECLMERLRTETSNGGVT
jgi:hypothetical protein